ncbi:cytokinin dehydrogenase 9-like isoform X2 [Salvia splendens]|uniref:cytokinin dehydrogenase 9-like isoform X2 n=1 Tax=Salvia splendens TaxID=180675 RepID=UPI001C27312F|nr:cytokinin dehydrogenase 9-like isoform X2 [Salvia splendens]
MLLKQHTTTNILSTTVLLLCCCMPLSLPTVPIPVHGRFTFDGNEFAGRDFGNQLHSLPWAVLHPKKVSDVASTIKHVWHMGLASAMTVAARGHGHSLLGQAQAPHGIVISMESLRGEMQVVIKGKSPYVDAPAGELWINVLHHCLIHGLAPKSWTDYLHLTVGGTLSNAGISGQAFRHGPQISNVHQLEVITGKGEVVVCSEEKNADLFHGVLGGLGQFGIITRARISLEPAPKRVKWIRVVYSDFATFARDQERLIYAEKTFDYIEGLVIVNRTGLINNWRSSFDPQDPDEANQFVSDGRTLFCLELTMNFNPDEEAHIDKGPRSRAQTEIKRAMGSPTPMAQSPHPAQQNPHLRRRRLRQHSNRHQQRPRSHLPSEQIKVKINTLLFFFVQAFRRTYCDRCLYLSRWDNRTSFVTPDEDVFYLVAFLPHAAESEGLQQLQDQNRRILNFCDSAELGVKQYLPHYESQEEWRAHFGPRWEIFAQRKSAYDPLAILAPGQRIFQKSISIL